MLCIGIGICEDEFHFLSLCSKYKVLRQDILDPIFNKTELSTMSLNEKLELLMKSCQPVLLTYIKLVLGYRLADTIT